MSVRDLPSNLTLHDVPLGDFEIGSLRIEASLVSHPGPTVGYRISENGATLAYLPDHEPASGSEAFPAGTGLDLGVRTGRSRPDLLIHDAQYTDDEYPEHVGWGHSSLPQTLSFAKAAGVKRLVTFHHDPSHDDETISRCLTQACARGELPFTVVGGAEGKAFEV